MWQWAVFLLGVDAFQRWVWVDHHMLALWISSKWEMRECPVTYKWMRTSVKYPTVEHLGRHLRLCPCERLSG